MFGLVFSLGSERNRKGLLATLESVQTKAIRIIIRVYKATSSPAFNIKAGILLLKLYLEMLVGESLLRLATSTRYFYIIQMRSKRKLCKLTLLEAFTARFEPKWEITLRSVKKMIPSIALP